MADPRFRLAGPDDAEAVAQLHADSWRHHYRGAYADAFLDGDVVADRMQVWTARLQQSDARSGTRTVLALDDDDTLLGFAHVVFDDDPVWGALLDNLHVTYGRKRGGIGSQLLALTAQAVVDRPQPTGLYLWVLEQNVDAQAFYAARGSKQVERADVPAPGGVQGRLQGTPAALRMAWSDPSVLLAWL